MALAERLAVTARRLIEANGRTVIFQQRNRVPIDPERPWRTPATAINPVSAIAVFVEGEKPREPDELNGRRVSTVLAAVNSLPIGTDLNDYQEVVDGSSIWEINNIQIIRPGDLPILYKLEVMQ